LFCFVITWVYEVESLSVITGCRTAPLYPDHNRDYSGSSSL